jgi:hypothetical protein
LRPGGIPAPVLFKKQTLYQSFANTILELYLD